MKDKFYRFYWVEHPTGMIVAIILITLGYGMAKKSVNDATKYKKAFWFFFVALILILATVPWPFRQIIGRPLIPGM
jgi:membrane protein DedA with SNARE-associated domain